MKILVEKSYKNIIMLFLLLFNFSFYESDFKEIFRLLSYGLLLLGYVRIYFNKNSNKDLNYINKNKYIFVGITLIFIMHYLTGKITTDSIVKYIYIYVLFYSVILIIPMYANETNVYSILGLINRAGMLNILISFILKPNNYMIGRNLKGDMRIRYLGIFSHPNHLGALCIIGILTCVILIHIYKKKKFIINIILYLIILIISNSRTPIIILIIYLICFILYSQLNKIRDKYLNVIINIIIFIIIFILIIITIYYFYENKYIWREINIWMSGRLDSMVKLVKYNKYILFGQGSMSNLSVANILGKPVDSSVALTYYQFGVFGIIIFYGNLVKQFIQSSNLDKNRRTHVRCLIISLIIYSLMENNIFNLFSISGMYMYLMIYLLNFDFNNK